MELEAESALLGVLQALARQDETGDLVLSLTMRNEPGSRFWTAEVVLREDQADPPRPRPDRGTLSHPYLTGMSRDELDRRTEAWKMNRPPPKYSRGYYSLYIQHVLQADRGCDLDFLVGRRSAGIPRESH